MRKSEVETMKMAQAKVVKSRTMDDVNDGQFSPQVSCDP
jgi:hypothetical protein